jgi:hypothetical protein
MLKFIQKYRATISLSLLFGYLYLFLAFITHYHYIDVRFGYSVKQQDTNKLPDTSTAAYYNINSNCLIHTNFSSVHTITIILYKSNQKIDEYLILSLSKFEIPYLTEESVPFYLRAPPIV